MEKREREQEHYKYLISGHYYYHQHEKKHTNSHKPHKMHEFTTFPSVDSDGDDDQKSTDMEEGGSSWSKRKRTIKSK